MAPTTFRSLQDRHEVLLQKQQNLSEENQKDFSKEVQEYIEGVKRGGSYVPSTRERDQLRANLRYWANYIYGVDGTFPDTELAPASVQRKSFLVTPVIALATIVLVLAFAGVRFLLSPGPSSAAPTEIAFNTPVSVSPTVILAVPTQTSEPVQITESPTPPSIGSVVLASPQNGANVPPKVMFTGTYTNLQPNSSIHILLVENDRVYPVEDHQIVSPDSTSGAWRIKATLYKNPEDLDRAESFIVVPAVCLNKLCTDTLSSSDSIETGFAIDSLPSQFVLRLYQESSHVVYRGAYQAITGTRLVYSIFYENESSYDLYISKPDRSDVKRIKYTPDINEIFPNLSPDGTKIVYVKRFQDPSSGSRVYAVAIMDSNGDNDHEITSLTKNVLESPQWSPDGSYIAYAMGEPTETGNDSYWSIHAFQYSVEEDKAGEDKIVSIGPKRLLNTYRYHCWIPNSHVIVFNTRKNETGTSGFVQVSIDTPEKQSLLFDTNQEDLHPDIKILEDKYLLSYALSNPDGTLHDIYAILDSPQQLPYDDFSSSKRLTSRKAGDIVNGVKEANADFPISDPTSNSIYFMKNVNIYKINFTINKEGKLELLRGSKIDGDLVVETGLKDQISGFDVGNMEAFFPKE